ncbi:hypothetical protein [Arthrobacter sp. KK5.5]|uniref:hypothetical protein n=1 Tax=Arthrobacter sp. KK5.5 TaxID=3373084 RepID=UPI003EE720D2
MRWDALFADLEAQMNGEAARDRVVEIQEMVRIERSQLPLARRLGGHLGGEVTLLLLGGLLLRGRLQRVGAGWLGLVSGGAEYVVPVAALRSVEGVGVRVAPEENGGRRLPSLGAALRALVRDRARVTLHARDGAVLGTGTLDHAGADHLQLAAHPLGEFRRGSSVRSLLLVPFDAVAAVQRDP